MKLKTLVVEEKIAINKDDIITFEKGLYGFESIKNYIIIDNQENPFKWLHATDDEVCFVILDPRHVDESYDFEVDDQMLHFLGADETTEFLLFCIVVIPEEIKDMTINLKSPIIINKSNNKAIQLILDEEQYAVKHKIVSEIMKGT
ncbi:MAG: flagellar assembly protein FliW [Clostridia bacterium]|nr:flagellar assembly protein FliW [Clostridia bacterium]